MMSVHKLNYIIANTLACCGLYDITHDVESYFDYNVNFSA